MLKEVQQDIVTFIQNFPQNDTFLQSTISKNNFTPLIPSSEEKVIAFIDGGEATLINGASFSVSLIRVATIYFKGKKKIKQTILSFYLLTTAKNHNGQLFYEGKIYSLTPKEFSLPDLFFSSYDETIRLGTEQASLTTISHVARRFAELKTAAQVSADFIILDGTLQKAYNNEEKYLSNLAKNVGALAKTSALYTKDANNPSALLHSLAPDGCWSYSKKNISFVKLHPKSSHIFRYEGDTNALPPLLFLSCDAFFVGYPYGLIAADQLARVSNEEKKSLILRFILGKNSKSFMPYLNSQNAHEILDKIKY